MNSPEDALEELREEQEKMVRQAQEMETRALILKKLSVCFIEGFEWSVDYTIDETQLTVPAVRLTCKRSGAWVELGQRHTLGPRNHKINITLYGIDYTLQEFFNAHTTVKEGEE